MIKILKKYILIVPLFLLYGCLPTSYEYFTVEPVDKDLYEISAKQIAVLPYFGFGELKKDLRKLKIYRPPLDFFIRIQNGVIERNIIKLSDIKVFIRIDEEKIKFLYSDWKNWKATQTNTGVDIIYSSTQKVDFIWEDTTEIIVEIELTIEFKEGKKNYYESYKKEVAFKPVHKETNAFINYLSQ